MAAAARGGFFRRQMQGSPVRRERRSLRPRGFLSGSAGAGARPHWEVTARRRRRRRQAEKKARQRGMDERVGLGCAGSLRQVRRRLTARVTGAVSPLPRGA